jgi:hypothetical protein
LISGFEEFFKTLTIVKYIAGPVEYVTLGTEMFYPGGFWLETRVIIKIATHPC